jgi:hypothetical protein
MKKVTVVIALAFVAIGLSLGSCKKCSTCSFTYMEGGQQFSYTYPEQCGKTSDIDAYKTGCATAAAMVGSTCSCTSK